MNKYTCIHGVALLKRCSECDKSFWDSMKGPPPPAPDPEFVVVIPKPPEVKGVAPGAGPVVHSDPRAGRLVELASYTLLRLAGPGDWNADTLHDIGAKAAELGLLEPDEDRPGFCRITSE